MNISLNRHAYGDFLNFNPHLHAIVPDGCFLGDSDFRMAPMDTGQDLSEAFRHEVLTMLKKEGIITDAVIENMMSWHHSGFKKAGGKKTSRPCACFVGGICRMMITGPGPITITNVEENLCHKMCPF